MRIIKLNQRGSAILLSVFAMVFVLSLVYSYVCVLNSDVMITRNQGYGIQSFYIAEAGLNHMLWRVFNRNGDIDNVTAVDTQSFSTNSNAFSTGTCSYSVTISEAEDGDVTLDSAGTNADLSGTDFSSDIQLVLSNLALLGTAVAFSESLPNAASRANDGDRATSWQAGGAGEQWIYIDMGSTHTISKIMYRSNRSDFTVEVSGDALSWGAVGNPYQEPASPASPDNIYVVFNAVQCRYVRLHLAFAASVPWVYEFFIYANPEEYDISE